MALYTSTPKSKLLLDKKACLISLDGGEDDCSSGYESTVYASNKNKNYRCQRKLKIEKSSDDSEFSSEESTKYEDSSFDYDHDDDDLDGIELTQSMKVTTTQTLIDNIQYILSVPELCDVMFIVGPHRVPVYGLKAILSTRSRSFFIMFLKHSKEALTDKKKAKKAKSQQNKDQSNKLSIIIENYDADVFRSFFLFVHSGSVMIETSSATGLLCLATEFEIPDLRNACWEFLERCMLVPANSSVLMKETFKYSDHKAAQKLRLKILRMPTPRHTSHERTDNTNDHTLQNSEQYSHISIETIV